MEIKDYSSIEYCTGTDILSIWYYQTLWRMIFRLSPREEHFRFIDGKWYDANTFKLAEFSKSYELSRLREYMKRSISNVI